ncbi:RNA-splicing ligase RtcB [Halobacteriales archaeon SW_5_70_135]|nr:MAG: RNA-splicing ligase RtcB [Halobacteriales archaeon SW_5_70_135]
MSTPETYDAGEVTLHRVREYVWELPREGEMNVPARVLASCELLDEISDDLTLTQLRDATHLPGIVDPAICMPDGHQGYGFPVGGVGATDAETGCISPGSIGYDINCLTGDTEVTLEHGRRRPIRELGDRFEDERAVVLGDSAEESDIWLFTEDEETVYEVETQTGQTVRATAGHPFLTPDGMRELSEIGPGDELYLRPFTGVEDDDPEEFVVVAGDDLDDANRQAVAALRERDLLPLRSTDDAFARLLKLVGYHTGDGSFTPDGVQFYGCREGLERLREDVRALGFGASEVRSRDREHDVNDTEFEATEHSVHVGSVALKRLLRELGAPESPKVESAFTTPEYLDRLPAWQVALYLSAYFGAEMSTPAAMTEKNLYCPTVSNSRVRDTVGAGERFLREIADHLASLGVETNAIEHVESGTDTKRDTTRLRIGLKSDFENLIRFFSAVNYRYAPTKRREAAVATQYLRYKEQAIERRSRIAGEAAALADDGTPVAELRDRYDVDDRFVERSVWSGREGRPRPPSDFPGYEEFRAETAARGELVATSVTSVEEVGERTVYDIGVEHEAHNFVANGFVVSNCGIRMLRTDLTYDDVRGREEELVESLFEAVPSGLGGGGVVHTSTGELESILDRGVEWALQEGYAVPADLEHCEDGGSWDAADADAVSEKAKERGKEQVGSLGSGNHFLEVQRVTDVYRDDVAAAYGLFEDQVVVLVHCGSRGLGHQVCTDYLRRVEGEHADLLERLPDKELAAAPAGSGAAEDYYAAMGAAINFAWTNRQLITHRTRQVFERVFGEDWESLGVDLLYDVAHNIGKREVHEVPVDASGLPTTRAAAVERAERELFVHRKGATRAFPASRPEVPAAHRDVGQPVIIPGSMGAGSYVLRGGEASLRETFGSTAHGAGRLMSRTQAKDEFWGGDVRDDLRHEGVYVKANSGATVAEEAPDVYKDVDEVVRVSDALGIGDRVARTFPVCNVKG